MTYNEDMRNMRDMKYASAPPTPCNTPCMSPVKPTTRIDAFEALANKSTMNKKLTCTNMCRSVVDGSECPHGIKCRFAHSLDELNISNCVFGDECRFVILRNNKLLNNGKICRHKHPQESRQEFYDRTGLNTEKVDRTMSLHEHVLKVPKELAIQAVELALLANMTRIRLEILD